MAFKEYDDTLVLMKKINTAKRNDYASDENPFSNFELCEKMGICSVEQGILVRMCDKFARLCNLLNKDAKVLDEKKDDTALDLSIYSVLLRCYLLRKQNEKKL